MARTKGALNYSTILTILKKEGLYRPEMETNRDAGKAAYQRHLQGQAPTESPALQPKHVEAIKHAVTAIEKPLVQPRPLPKPVEDNLPPTPFMQRVAARQAAIRAKLEAARASMGEKTQPPFDMSNPEALLDTTVVAGRTIAEWARVIEDRKDRARGHVADLTDLPKWVTWAVSNWQARGCLLKRDLLKEEYESLLEKADKQEKYATMDEEEAKKLDESASCYKGRDKLAKRDRQRAEKKRKAAQEKRQKAVTLRAEAEKLLAKMKNAA